MDSLWFEWARNVTADMPPVQWVGGTGDMGWTTSHEGREAVKTLVSAARPGQGYGLDLQGLCVLCAFVVNLPVSRQYAASPLEFVLTAGTPRQPIVVIPARLASTRLPDKPLADIHGEPMIVHVWRRAVEAAIGPVLVACGDAAIVDAVKAAGGEAVLTRADHPSGSDRIFEAVQKIDPEGRHDAVVNVQGDTPTVDPPTMRAALAPLADAAVDIGTIVTLIRSAEERDNPNMVKAAVAFGDPARGRPLVGRALYFSRLPVPSGQGPHYHHVGIYAFRRKALARFVALPPGVLEQRERLEQLRALEAGMRIDVALVDSAPFGVDTPADLARARAILTPK
jgi:3-deoxy-manno-octulosonate cytidylyltransferase (CMP-KDO synthetase)